MTEFSSTEKTILVQYGIKKYENEETVFEKLKTIMSEKDIQRNIDTLIATQIVRRIGPEVLQNNESHTELPDLPDNLKSIIENLLFKILLFLEDVQFLDGLSSILLYLAFLVYLEGMYLLQYMHLNHDLL